MLKVPTGHVVKEFMIGKTRIKICDDDYINKTPEQLKKQEIELINACYVAVKNSVLTKNKKTNGSD